MISKETEGQIVRLYQNEKWKIGTIASHLKVHHSVVRRVLQRLEPSGNQSIVRPLMVEPYLPFVREQLEKYPDITATRLWRMCVDRGFTGKADWFREVLRRVRPPKQHEAFLRRATLPGEEGQVDWAHFGRIKCGQMERSLCAFIMVLSWSRQVFLRFFLSMEMGAFLAGHNEAFDFFGGVPRKILYDNLKTAVTENQGDYVTFNEVFLTFASHCKFEPRPCAVRRPQSKGRVERAVQYARTSFFAGRRFTDLDDLNAQAREWCLGLSGDRRHPEDATHIVRTAWAHEKTLLLKCPDNPFDALTVVAVKIGKTPYARVDRNDYSVPPAYVRKEVTAYLSEKEVLIVGEGGKQIARHQRSWDKGVRVEDKLHIEELLDGKARGKKDSATDRVQRIVPSSRAFIGHMHEEGANIGGVIQCFLKCIEQYGADFVELATSRVLQSNKISLGALRLTLDKISHEKNRTAHIVPIVPENPSGRNIIVQQHPLSTWQFLMEGNTGNAD